MRKTLSVLLLIFMLFACSFAHAENMLKNPDFAHLDEMGFPEDWYTDAWNFANTEFSVVQDADGQNVISIYNYTDNDARFVQDVKTEANTVYKFTCLAKAEGVNDIDAMGGCISFLNTNVYSDAVYETEGEWTKLTLYGKTGKNQTTLSLCARLGGYGFVSAGRVCFKSFTMEKVSKDELSALGVIPVSLSTFEPSNNRVSSFETQTAEAPVRKTENHLMIAFFTLLVSLYMLRTAKSRLDSSAASERKLVSALAFSFILVLGFAVRVFIALRYRGYAVDVTNFEIWGSSFFSSGASFYAQQGLHDYPPLYMLILGIMDVIRRIFGISSDSAYHVLLIKLTPILCDLIFGLVLYVLSSRKIGERRARWLLAAVVFNPAYLINSAAWGQVDSVLALAVSVCLLYAVSGKWHIALPVFAVSMLLKPQALLFGPVGLAAYIADLIRSRKDKQALVRMALALVISLFILYLTAFPFAVYESMMLGNGLAKSILSPVSWLISLYSDTTSGYSYITVNALNFYQLFNLNWTNVESVPGFKVFAWIMMAYAYLFSIGLNLLSRDRKSLPLSGACLISIIFSFGPMMHERYLFPVLALLLIAYAFYGDRRLLYVFIAFTVTQYLNQALVLQCGMVSEYAYMGHLSNDEWFINRLLSIVNLLSTFYLLYVCVCLCILKKPAKPLIPEAPLCMPCKERLLKTSDYKLRLKRLDYLLMAIVTCVYSVFAFTNLGSAKAPETFYKNTSYRESIVFDLGQTRSFRMTYYGGISPSTFTVSLSNDGENWTEENYAVYSEGEIFKWHWWAPKTYENSQFSNASAPAYAFSSERTDVRVSYSTQNTPYPIQSARYVRLTIEGVGLPLHEVGFWDVENEVLYPVSSVTGTNASADYTALTDEQDTIPFTPSYYNGMYFDEIYHARTAYEFDNELSVLEWSHPHLGKILIMFGIRIFGMNPFGWRFMGALFGVLMLPAMYLLAKQLTKKTSLSFIAMFLMAVDSMHFTQSRIATVDTYAVFFIMVMYLFMFRYWQMNMNICPLHKTFVPLGLSGIFFALACASKWIGLYAGIGLAVIFFTSVFFRFKEFLYAAKKVKAGKGTDDEIRIKKTFLLNLLYTLLFCIVFFIVIPVIIYFLTYYWHFAPEGKFNVQEVWAMQKQMFGYHNGLGGDTHYFRSPWYEWPMIKKPMWYYSSDIAYLGLGVVSSISCMGNPAVWWTGAVALVAVLLYPAFSKKSSSVPFLIGIGFASQFLPWVLITRSTFIYHYFASVPFIILASVYLLGKLKDIDKYAFYTAAGTLMAVALVLFIAFYPLESGYPCSYEYALHLRWFDWYNFQLQ